MCQIALPQRFDHSNSLLSNPLGQSHQGGATPGEPATVQRSAATIVATAWGGGEVRRNLSAYGRMKLRRRSPERVRDVRRHILQDVCLTSQGCLLSGSRKRTALSLSICGCDSNPTNVVCRYPEGIFFCDFPSGLRPDLSLFVRIYIASARHFDLRIGNPDAMPRRASPRPRKPRRGTEAVARPAPSRRLHALFAGAAVSLALIVLAILWLRPPRAPESAMNEARKALENGQAARAERALMRTIQLEPGDPEPWLLLLELLRVEDRQIEAQEIGWNAYRAVRGPSQRLVLRAMTLALLADTPEDLARSTLARWSDADPSDIDARVALLQRIALSPRAGDPDRASRIRSLSTIVAEHPKHIGAYEALILALADSGEPDRGREVLNVWPSAGRDARYSRLKGRWDLEYDHQPAQAAKAFRDSLKVLPHDWRTRYRLARALRNAGHEDEAKQAAVDVEKLREALDPISLGRRLDKDLAALGDPKSRLDLADLCQRASLLRLAEAWKRDAQ